MYTVQMIPTPCQYIKAMSLRQPLGAEEAGRTHVPRTEEWVGRLQFLAPAHGSTSGHISQGCSPIVSLYVCVYVCMSLCMYVCTRFCLCVVYACVCIHMCEPAGPLYLHETPSSAMSPFPISITEISSPSLSGSSPSLCPLRSPFLSLSPLPTIYKA